MRLRKKLRAKGQNSGVSNEMVRRILILRKAKEPLRTCADCGGIFTVSEIQSHTCPKAGERQEEEVASLSNEKEEENEKNAQAYKDLLSSL